MIGPQGVLDVANMTGTLPQSRDRRLHVPPALLEAPEGLSDVSFVDRFGGLDETAYREAVLKIDRMLAQQGRLAPSN